MRQDERDARAGVGEHLYRVAEDGTFRWSKARGTVDTEADTASLRFKGKVYFYGHDAGSGPLLQIWVDVPRLELAGDTGVLVADVTSRDLASDELVEYDDVHLTDLDLVGTDVDANRMGVVKLDGMSSILTADGAAAFAGFYPAGTELDPVGFRVKLRPWVRRSTPRTAGRAHTKAEPV